MIFVCPLSMNCYQHTRDEVKMLKENIFQKHTRLEKMEGHFVKDVVLKTKFEKILHIFVLLVQIIQVSA